MHTHTHIYTHTSSAPNETPDHSHDGKTLCCPIQRNMMNRVCKNNATVCKENSSANAKLSRGDTMPKLHALAHSALRGEAERRANPFGKLSLFFFSLNHPENEETAQRDTAQISRFYESLTAGLLGMDLELDYDKYQDRSQISINLQQLYG